MGLGVRGMTAVARPHYGSRIGVSRGSVLTTSERSRFRHRSSAFLTFAAACGRALPDCRLRPESRHDLAPVAPRSTPASVFAPIVK